MTKQYVKTRCNGCMTYFEYGSDEFEHDEEGFEICPFCKTSAYLTDLTEEDIQYFKENGLY